MSAPFRLLLVEDEAFIRELVITLCGEWGVEARAVADGAAALRAARERLPDLVLLDIVLPGLDGIAVCRLLKADPATRPVPVYMLSARVRDADRDAASRAGADGYLDKPFRAAALHALIERHRTA
jgi:CheY-like chemotaxis protein